MQKKGQSNPSGQQPASPAGGRRAVVVPPVPPEFQAEKIMRQPPEELVRILQDPAATVFQKAKACQRLAVVGSKEAVPALAALLDNQQLSHYARFGLAPIPDPSVDEALRDALKRVKGRLLVGIINTLGQRRDAQAVAPLARLIHDPDLEVARAAAAAVGHIGGAQGAKALQEALARTKGAVHAAVAGGGLLCAESLLAQGDRKQAFALYDLLSRADIPKPVRLAAMHGTISAETSLTRPR